MAWKNLQDSLPPEGYIIVVCGDGFIETVVREGDKYHHHNTDVPSSPRIFSAEEIWLWMEIPPFSHLSTESLTTGPIKWSTMREGDLVSLLNPSSKWLAAGNEFKFTQAYADWSNALQFIHVPTGKRLLLGKHNEYTLTESLL